MAMASYGEHKRAPRTSSSSGRFEFERYNDPFERLESSDLFVGLIPSHEKQPKCEVQPQLQRLHLSFRGLPQQNQRRTPALHPTFCGLVSRTYSNPSLVSKPNDQRDVGFQAE